MNRERINRLAMAGVLAVTGIAASSAPQAAEAGGSVRNINCTDSSKWYTLNQGEAVSLRTKAAVATADLKVDGVRQYDDRAETSTVLGFKSKDRYQKTWRLDVDYPGAILVFKCGVSDANFYKGLGRETFKQDVNNGANDAAKTTNSQSLVK